MRRSCGALLLVLSSVFVLHAQSPDSAAVRGHVTGPNGHSVNDTRVVIEDAQHRPLRSVVPGPDGNFAVEGLPPEVVTVRADGQDLEASSGENPGCGNHGDGGTATACAVGPRCG